MGKNNGAVSNSLAACAFYAWWRFLEEYVRCWSLSREKQMEYTTRVRSVRSRMLEENEKPFEGFFTKWESWYRRLGLKAGVV